MRFRAGASDVQVLAWLEFAREWLAKGGQPITEIALHCGYRSSQAFALVFCKKDGATPAAYRREVGCVRAR